MNVYFALFLNFLPFLVCFFAFKFFLKINFSTELFASLFGLIAVLPIEFLQFYLFGLIPEFVFENYSDLVQLFFKTLIFNGLLEELLKMIFILFIPHKKLNFKAFFAVSLLLGLCLASFESMIYFLNHLSKAKQSNANLLYGLIFARMFSSDLIHAFCSGLCGIFIWGIRNKKIDFMTFIYAVICHGIFDFFVYFNNFIHWFAIVAILFAIIECRVRAQKLFSEKESVAKKARRASERKNQGKNGTQKKSAKKESKVGEKKSNSNNDKTVVTSSLEKKPRKSVRTKTKAQKPKIQEKEEIPEDVDVTPELNDEI